MQVTRGSEAGKPPMSTVRGEPASWSFAKSTAPSCALMTDEMNTTMLTPTVIETAVRRL